MCAKTNRALSSVVSRQRIQNVKDLVSAQVHLKPLKIPAHADRRRHPQQDASAA